MDIHCADIAGIIKSPYQVEKVITLVYLIRISNQQFQKIKLLSCQVDFLILDEYTARLQFNPEVTGNQSAGCALLCLAGLGASCVIFFHRFFFKLPGVRFFVDKAEKYSRGSVSRMTGATDCYAGHWPLLALLTILTTVFVHLFSVVPYIFLFRGLGVEFSYFTLVTAVVLGNIAGLIPFFPGGIGIRDLVTVTILSAGAVAPADAKTVQLIATAVMLLTYFSGGVFFILDPGRRNRQKGADS
jgi:uncharacterized membrane protein YbhN (UPF0104 family)